MYTYIASTVSVSGNHSLSIHSTVYLAGQSQASSLLMYHQTELMDRQMEDLDELSSPDEETDEMNRIMTAVWFSLGYQRK